MEYFAKNSFSMRPIQSIKFPTPLQFWKSFSKYQFHFLYCSEFLIPLSNQGSVLFLFYFDKADSHFDIDLYFYCFIAFHQFSHFHLLFILVAMFCKVRSVLGNLEFFVILDMMTTDF